MPAYAYINRILNMYRSQIHQNSEYGRVLNIWTLHGVLNMPEYMYLNVSQVLNMPRALNMQELHRDKQYDYICPNRTWISLNMFEFSIIARVLNMYHTIHTVRVTLQVNEYLLRDGRIQNPAKDLKMERFGKIILLNDFAKKLNLKF